MTSRATDYDVITVSQIASNSSLYILFQYDRHKIYLKSELFSVSEKETNFSITPRITSHIEKDKKKKKKKKKKRKTSFSEKK